MQKIRIITDSASDLMKGSLENVQVLPMTIRFGEQEYRDNVDLSTGEFYKKLSESSELPTTSLISPAVFEEAYRAAVQKGEKVVVITISGKLSGTYQSAVLAAQEFEGEVFVVDSKTVAVGEQVQVRYAKSLADSGVTAEEIARILEQKRDQVHVLAVIDTLKYLQMGGRISKASAFVGGALSVKPVVTTKDGEVVILGKARGSKNGNNFLMREIESTAGIDFEKPICLGFTGQSDELLSSYIEDSRELWQEHVEPFTISHIGPTIGVHIGPGAIAVAFYSK